MKRTIASVLIAIMVLNPAICHAKEVKHIYIPEGVETLVIAAKKIEFKKEEEQFRDFRFKYGILWAGIIGALIYYAYSKGKK